MSTFPEKRKKVEDLILKVMKTADPSKINYNRYKKLFEDMSDSAFKQYFKEIRDPNHPRVLTIYTANMVNNLKKNDLLDAMKIVGIPEREYVTFYDSATGRTYQPPEPVLVLELPVRRQIQNIDHGMSVPESDKTTDLFTGQVIRPDKGSSISMTEMSVMVYRGLIASSSELVGIRGGNLANYSMFKASLEDTGEVRLADLDPNSKPRVAHTVGVRLKSAMIDNNL